MPPLCWFLLSAYLLVAVGSLLEVEFASGRGATADPLRVCFVALIYAAAWPLPRLRKVLLGALSSAR
jgi:hypothetical protein